MHMLTGDKKEVAEVNGNFCTKLAYRHLAESRILNELENSCFRDPKSKGTIQGSHSQGASGNRFVP